jgi:hypothetical protein
MSLLILLLRLASSHENVPSAKIVVIYPPPPNGDSTDTLPVIPQPFSVITSVELVLGVDYADWKHCYRVETSLFVDYCSIMMISDEGVQFSPILATSPPEFDMLAPTETHRLVAWFESISNPGIKWAIESVDFMVTASSVRTSDGGYKYIDYKDNLTRHASYSISALIVEPRNHPNIPVAIRNVLSKLPSVRPIHLFHGKSYEPCQTDPFLCDLIESEVVVPHRLTVDNLSFMDYNRLLLDEILWSSIHSEKVLVFQTDTAVCGTNSLTNKLVRDFSHLDYVGAHQVVSYFIGSPPVLVEEELLGGNGGFSLRDVNLSKQCVKMKRASGLGRDQEDVYFPTCFKELGGKVADVSLQRRFATHGEPEEEEGGASASTSQCSLGAHKINTFTSKGLSFVKSCCPEYLSLMNGI